MSIRGKVILVVSVVMVVFLVFALFTGLIQFNIGTPSHSSVKKTTARVILQEISLFEDEACTRPVQTIEWGYVESNHSYSRTFYARNEYARDAFDERDIVWQRLNINPDSVYISIKLNYGSGRIAPNEVRQVTVTLTVLGLLDSSGKLNPNAEVPQFTFDLLLKGEWLNIFAYVYVRAYANRDANNITVVYKDDLKETISVIAEIKYQDYYTGQERLAWNTTKYVSQFTETWLGADIYTHYWITIRMNHERYGELVYRTVLPGHFLGL